LCEDAPLVAKTSTFHQKVIKNGSSMAPNVFFLRICQVVPQISNF
jgi:hypothetical protein